MKKLLYSLFALIIVASSCKNDDVALPDNLVNFSATAQGLAEGDASADVTVTLSRSTNVAVPVEVELVPTGVTYGTEFTTVPAAVNNKISLSIPAGSTTAIVKLIKTPGIFLNGDEFVNFNIKSAGGSALTGTTTAMKLSFSAITSTGTELTLNGGEGGSAAINTVYVDLSANYQTSVNRKSWDLGFYTGTDFRVIINNTAAASAVEINKTDLAQVSAADVTLANLELGFGKGTFDIIDDVNGDLNKTVIGQVSATASDNKVYVINRLGGSGVTSGADDLIKIKVTRAANGYALQYAKLNETTFKTLTITKDSKYNFNFISFDTDAAVAVEPAKDRWDFQWTYSIYFTQGIPYPFSDLVFTNYLGGVQTAEVLTSTVSYDAFAEANISAVNFSNSRNTISSNWRNTTGTVGVKTDRFYVIKDAAGNVYKLKFISFTTQDGGTRGYPKLQYALVKKG